MNKKFYRHIERLLRHIDASTSTEEMLRRTVRGIVDTGTAWGIESGRLYREQERDYLLIESIGEFGARIVGKTVSKDYPVVRALEREQIVMISSDYPGFDPELESQFSHLDYAAILVAAEPSYVLSFGARRNDEDGNLYLMLETIRTAISLRLRQRVFESQLRQAQTIQVSLLPRELPRLPGFEIAAATYPAEEVGGDVYDALLLDDGLLSLTVADASGHGLPAALQARDVITGLRMGVAKDQKMTATIRRLNRVINSSGLSSRFVSLFYAEVEEAGAVIYVNAGHCAPLLFNPSGAVFELPSTGPVLGPLPDTKYRRSWATLRPGEILLIFTDGLIEQKPGAGARPESVIGLPGPPSGAPAVAPSVAPAAGGAAPAGNPAAPARDEPGDEEFGQDRLIKVVQANLGRRAQQVLEAIVEAVREFSGGEPWDDDATLMVVRRLPADEYRPKKTLGTVLSIEQAKAREQRAPRGVERAKD